MAITNPSFSDDDYFIIEYAGLDIRTIAITLGRICRFAGGCNIFWPVLLHSLVVALLVPERFAIHALLHDAAEIYIGDVPSPFKSFLISSFEESGIRSIYRKLGIPFPTSDARKIVHEADIKAQVGEVWTVEPERLKVLREFQSRCQEAESLTLNILKDYDYKDVLDPEGKYVKMFVEQFESLRNKLTL